MQYHPFDETGVELGNRDTARFVSALGRTLIDPFVHPSTDRRLLDRSGEGSALSGVVIRGDLQS